MLLSEDFKLTRSGSSLDQNSIYPLAWNSFLFGHEMVAVDEIEKDLVDLPPSFATTSTGSQVVEWCSGTPNVKVRVGLLSPLNGGEW